MIKKKSPNLVENWKQKLSRLTNKIPSNILETEKKNQVEYFKKIVNKKIPNLINN